MSAWRSARRFTRNRRNRCSIYESHSTMKRNYILGISAYYHDSAACLVATARSSPPRRRSASRARSTTRLPDARRRLLPARGRHRARRPRLRRLLRQAAAQVRAPARDLPGFAPQRLPLVPAWRCRSGSRRSCITDAQLRRRARRLRGTASLRRAPRVARGQRVLPVAVRRGGHPDASTASASGRPPSIGVGRGNDLELLARAALSRTRSACSTRRSPTTPASR